MNKPEFYAACEAIFQTGHVYRDIQPIKARSESRSAQIAYGYLRGRTYQQIEGATKSEPDWKRVQRLIEKYGPKGQTDLEAKLQAWREAV